MIAAHRYAQAILDIAQQSNASEQIYSNANELINLIKSNRDFLNFIKSPLIKSDKKEKVFKQLFEKNIHQILIQFISILCKRRREYILPEILNAITAEYKKRNKIVSAQLITAFKFDEELKNNLVEKMKKIKSASQVELNEQINPEIIGGFILKTDNEQIDTSIRSQLNQLYQKFIQTNSLN